MSKSLEFYSLSLQLKICLKRFFVAKGALEKSVLKRGNSLENVLNWVKKNWKWPKQLYTGGYKEVILIDTRIVALPDNPVWGYTHVLSF